MTQPSASLVLNGVHYRRPAKPVVVVCIDGGAQAYLDEAISAGLAPNAGRFLRNGFAALSDGTVPSFTCPNNMSLITGSPPSVHGISGNFYLDTATGEAVVMTGPELLRSRTLLSAFADVGARVAAITAKDKLRRQLGKGLDVRHGNVCFSAERADRCTVEENGLGDALSLADMPLPDIYSMDLSLFVLAAGVNLLRQCRPELMFLSLTDYIQHKHAPGDPVANEFYRRLDLCFGELAAQGAVVALTADHGMSDKAKPNGEPNVIFLQDILDERFGRGATTVICPITDAFVAHHGALGGFVRVWCRDARATPQAVIDLVRDLPGVEAALNRTEVCQRFSLPADREGDVAVIARADTCIGAGQADHDLADLGGVRLRSHGGVSEAEVPFILSHPLNAAYLERARTSRLRSYQIFDFAINGCDPD